LAVCGTGLDVIPLLGDVSVEKLEKILLDVASISFKDFQGEISK